MSPGDNWFTSQFISVSRAAGIAATLSAKASTAYGPPSVNHENMSFSSVVTASPMVSSKRKRLSSTDTMTIFATPRLVESSVDSLISSNVSSRTKTELRTVTKGNTDNDMQGRSSLSAHTSSSYPDLVVVPKHSDQSVAFLDESTPFVPQETLRFSKVSTLVETNSHLTEVIQTAPSFQSKASEEVSVMSPSFEENFPSSLSVKITQNVVKKTSVYLKVTSEALDKNLSSPFSQAKLTMHSTDWAVSTMSEQFSLMASSTLNIDHHVRFSQFSESSVVSQALVAPSSFSIRSRSQMQNKTKSAATSTSNIRHRIGLSSYQSHSTVVPSLSSPVMSRSKVPHQSSTIPAGSFKVPHQNSTIPAGSHLEHVRFTSTLGHQIRLSSSQSSTLSSELVALSSSPMNSTVHVLHEKSPTFTDSYHESPSSISKIKHQIRLSSSQGTPLYTKLVVPSSTWQSPSQVPTEKRSVVRESYRKPAISTSGVRHQIPSTSSLSLVVSTAYVKPSSLPVTSRSKILHHRSSLYTGSYHNVLLSTSQIRQPMRISSSQSSAVSSVENTSSPQQSRSQIVYSTSASITSSQQTHLTSSTNGYQICYSSKSAALSTIASLSSSFLKSHSQIPHNRSSVSIESHSTIDHQIRFPYSQSSVMSTELVQPSSHTMSHSKTPNLRTTSVTTSIVHESLPVTSKIGHHVHFSSIQGSVPSTELLAPSFRHTQSPSQTPHSTIAVPTSTFHERLSSTSDIEHHAHFSSVQSSVASTELVPPSSYPNISSQGSQKRSSTGAKHPTPSFFASSTGSTFVDKGKLKTSSWAVAPPSKEFTSKINDRLVPAGSTTQLDTTVTPTEPSASSSPATAGSLSTGYPATTTTDSQRVNLFIIVAIVPSVVLCVFFTAVMFFRRNRRRKEKNFKYSIKLEYKDSIRSRCANSRLDLSLKEIHIDLELPNSPNERAQTRDSAGYSRGPSLTEMQMRELQILSQECKENLEWISEVIARDMETSICGRQPVNRESVYSVKEKGNYEPSEKIIRRESSKRGRETVKWRVPIVRRRDSGEFDQNDSICTDDTTLSPDCKDERAFERSNCKNVDKTGRVHQSSQMQENVESHANSDHKGPLSNNKLDELQRQDTDKKEKEFEENKQTVKDETLQKKHSGKRFETL